MIFKQLLDKTKRDGISYNFTSNSFVIIDDVNLCN